MLAIIPSLFKTLHSSVKQRKEENMLGHRKKGGDERRKENWEEEIINERKVFESGAFRGKKKISK